MPVPTDETHILVMYVISHVSCNGYSCGYTWLSAKSLQKPMVLPMKKNEGEKLFCFTLPNSSGSPARRHLASTLPETGISAMPRFYGTHFGSQITSEHKMPVQKVSFCIKKSHEKFRMNPAR